MELIFSLGTFLWTAIAAYGTILGILSTPIVHEYAKRNPQSFIAGLRYYLIEKIWRTQNISIENSEAQQEWNKLSNAKNSGIVRLKPSISGEILAARIPAAPVGILAYLLIPCLFISVMGALELLNVFYSILFSFSAIFSLYILIELVAALNYRTVGKTSFHIIADRFIVERLGLSEASNQEHRIKGPLSFRVEEKKQFFWQRKSIVIDGTAFEGFQLISVPSRLERFLMRTSLEGVSNQLNDIVSGLELRTEKVDAVDGDL